MFCVCVYSPRSLQDFSSRLPLCVQVFCVPCVGFPFVSRHCRFLFLCLGLSRFFFVLVFHFLCLTGVSLPLFADFPRFLCRVVSPLFVQVPPQWVVSPPFCVQVPL